MATLYEMTAQASALYEMLQAEEIDEQIFNDTLEAIGAGEKVDAYCQIIKQMQGEVEVIKTEMERLKSRKDTTENGIDRMKSALLGFLQASGQNKVKTALFSVTMATTQAVNITDESKIPHAFLVEQAPKIDKIGIKKALKEGENVSGAELTENVGVRIK